MNLCIDIGNTSVKAALFRGEKLREMYRFDTSLINEIAGIKEKYPVTDRLIVSSVRPLSKAIYEALENSFSKFVFLDHKTPLPLTNLYKTGESLGSDRLAAVVGANNIYPESNVLVVDAGTALTFDVVTKNRQYLGGTISPGINTRLKALTEFTARLPYISDNEEVRNNYGEILTADNTKDAIRAGVYNSIVYEVEGYISRLMEQYKPLKIIFTGGDANFFDKRLKYPIFVDLNLIFTGLNRILEYND